jgi:DTW domain-containing protein YfiP
MVVCWCPHLPKLTPRTEVVFLQHPRERHTPIGTARMAHLALGGSRLLEGLHFDDDPRLADLFAAAAVDDDSVAVLFPGAEARTLANWPGPPPRRLVVLDGTWHQAAKLLRENPRLAALPRLTFAPTAPGRYGIRKEPRAECLSTIEAVGAVLSLLEGDGGISEALLRPFDAMVEAQLDHAARARRPDADGDDGADGSDGALHRDERGRGRQTSRRTRRTVDRRFRELVPLLRQPERIVVVYAEANAAPRGARGAGTPGLLHLLAARPFAEGTPALDLVVRPREPIHPETLRRLGLQVDDVAAAVDAPAAIARFRTWCGDGRLLSWGSFPRDLLAREGDTRRGFVDLRALACRALDGAAGGLEAAALRFEVTLPTATTRGRRMLAAAVGISQAIARRARAEPDDGATRSGILPA